MTWQPPGSEVVWSAFPAPVNVAHGDESTEITIDMPGVGPEDLDLTFDAGTLAVTGKRGEKVYSYSVELGDAIDPDRIEAKLDKGVLSIRASKRSEAKPRKIAVNASASAPLAAAK
jgi:HSP20 family protein